MVFSLNIQLYGNVHLQLKKMLPWFSIGNLGAEHEKQKSIKQLVHCTCSHPSFFMYISKHYGQQLTLSSFKAYLMSSNLYGHF